MFVNYTFQRIWKKAAVAYFVQNLGISCLEGLRKITETLSQYKDNR